MDEAVEAVAARPFHVDGWRPATTAAPRLLIDAIHVKVRALPPPLGRDVPLAAMKQS